MLGILNRLSTSRKWRYTFAGRDVQGNIIFPEYFVKISSRPAMPVMAVASESGGKLVCIPGEFTITHFFDMYDTIEEQEEGKKHYEELVNKYLDVASGILRLMDGCGELVEEWCFYNVKLKLLPESYLCCGDENIVEWLVSYERCEWFLKKKDIFIGKVIPLPDFKENS